MVDVPGTIESDVTLSPGAQITGEMETVGDVDFYRVTLEAGTLYSILMSRFDEPITEFRLGLFDAEGEQLLLRDWVDGGVFPYVSAAFGVQVVETGTYFIAAYNTDSTGGWDHTLWFSEPEDFFGVRNIFGTTADDTFLGTAYADALYGRDGDDVISGRGGSDRVDGGAGDDALTGAQGKDRISGGDGGDTLSGGTQDDRLAGGDGDDVLTGGAGVDRLSGGAGQDSLTGGAGVDIFIFGPADVEEVLVIDTITDFNRRLELLDLRGFDGLAFTGRTASEGGVWFQRGEGGVQVNIDSSGDAAADHAIFLQGVARITAGEFLF